MEMYLTPTTVAIGNFDGLHRGHLRVIQPILNSDGIQVRDWQTPSSSLAATQDKSSCPKNSEQVKERCSVERQCYYPTVVTFYPHPKEYFSGKRRPSLTPLNEKVEQLLCLGVKQIVPLTFNQELAALSPQQFVEEILLQKLQAQKISVGHDFRFGHGQSGTASDLQAIAATFGIPVIIVPPYMHQGERISSSSIRQALKEGQLQQVQALLGHHYTLTGFVTKATLFRKSYCCGVFQLQLPPEKLLPRPGIYVVTVFMKHDSVQSWESSVLRNVGHEYPLTPAYKGIMNIGSTDVSDTQPSVEIFLLDQFGGLEGKTVTVQVDYFIQSEPKIPFAQALEAQIQGEFAAAH